MQCIKWRKLIQAVKKRSTKIDSACKDISQLVPSSGLSRKKSKKYRLIVGKVMIFLSLEPGENCVEGKWI